VRARVCGEGGGAHNAPKFNKTQKMPNPQSAPKGGGKKYFRTSGARNERPRAGASGKRALRFFRPILSHTVGHFGFSRFSL